MVNHQDRLGVAVSEDLGYEDPKGDNHPIRMSADKMNLTDMWRASGSEPAHRPVDWIRKEGAPYIAFLAEHLNVPVRHDGENQGLISVVRGGNDPHTLAHWQVGRPIPARRRR